jgi:hypothetical protein
MRMAILVAIVYIGAAMVVIVFPSAFNSIMKALALDVAKLLWWYVPSTLLGKCCCRSLIRLGNHEAGRGERENKC